MTQIQHQTQSGQLNSVINSPCNTVQNNVLPLFKIGLHADISISQQAVMRQFMQFFLKEEAIYYDDTHF